MIPLNMQAIKTGFQISSKALIKAAPTIGVIFGTGLMVGATVKTGLEAPKLKDELDELEIQTDISHKEYLKKKTRILLYHLGWPAVMTIGGLLMIFSGYKIKYTQAAIATAALASKTEEAEKLEKKIIEKYGPKEYEKMKDEMVKDEVKAYPIDYATVINTGHGNMLCWDPIIHDYYWSDLTFIEKMEREANKEIAETRMGENPSRVRYHFKNSAFSYNKWREYLDLPQSNEHIYLDRPVTNVDIGKDLGWYNNYIELKITAILLPDHTVVHAIGFTSKGQPKWYANIDDYNNDDVVCDGDYDESDWGDR